jgi:hypothetical protein
MDNYSWLSDEEVAALTRKKQAPAQERVLSDAGIKFKIIDERPVVLRSALEETPVVHEPKLRLARA